MHKQPPWFWLVLWFLPLAAHAQDVFTLTADRLQNGQAVELDKLGWKYSPDDEPRFADPQFDDRAWETLNGTAILLNSIPKSGWHGIGWFRLRLKAEPALANQPLALVMVHYGASEVYLDGKLIERFGTVGTTPETESAHNPNTLPIYLVLDAKDEHALAVRHSCMEMRDLSGGWGRWLAQQGFRGGVSVATNHTIDYGAGFGLQIADAQQTRDEQVNRRAAGGNYLLNIGLMLAIGSLHLLLFWFYPRERGSLFFGLLTYAFAAHNSLLYSQHFGHQSALRIMLHAGGIQALTMLGPGMLLAFMYTVFALRIPKWFWFWAIAALLYIPLDLLFVEGRPILGLYFLAIILFPVFEVVRGMRKPIRNRVAGAWVVGVAMLAYPLYSVIVMVVLAGNLPGTFVLVTLRSFVPLILTIAFSVFLARRFARTSLHLEEQLDQVQQLSAAALEHEKVKAENGRKTKELEEARQLQLSMLPKKLPDLPHLDIAAYMKTATEVGGDYYDFHLGDDGTLTIAVGDATGHGLKAGTMVTAVKSLFDTLAYHPDIPHIFERLTRTLKRMNLRGLFMAMTVAKIKQHQLVLSVAGMPPVLLYRAAAQQVEVVELKALPLGGVVNYRYQQLTFELAAGDAVVLLSDGLPERFNAQGEMLGEEPVQALLAQVGTQTAADIIAALIQAGDAWAGTHPQDDNVTMVVLKVR